MLPVPRLCLLIALPSSVSMLLSATRAPYWTGFGFRSWPETTTHGIATVGLWRKLPAHSSPLSCLHRIPSIPETRQVGLGVRLVSFDKLVEVPYVQQPRAAV